MEQNFGDIKKGNRQGGSQGSSQPEPEGCKYKGHEKQGMEDEVRVIEMVRHAQVLGKSDQAGRCGDDSSSGLRLCG